MGVCPTGYSYRPGGMGPDVYSDIKAGVKASAGKLRRPDAGDAGKGNGQGPLPGVGPPSGEGS